jgi:hypothetical protein
MKLHTQLEFFEIRLTGFLKNPDIFLKNCQKRVEELKFCMNELFNNVSKAFRFLKFRELHFGSFRKKMCFFRLKIRPILLEKPEIFIYLTGRSILKVRLVVVLFKQNA